MKAGQDLETGRSQEAGANEEANRSAEAGVAWKPKSFTEAKDAEGSEISAMTADAGKVR
ncbi:MAG: hypothetical protein LBT40_00235 [Deltaproteobacteria bacterium]|jgi:hypothetical protein|nr:hypothetical protein [Deltaproteobacteria bacterium]